MKFDGYYMDEISFSDSIIIIAPVFAIIFLGIVMGRTALFADAGQQKKQVSDKTDHSQDSTDTRRDHISASLIRYVNYVAIPALLVRSLAQRDLPEASEFMLLLGYYGGMYLIFALTLFLIAPGLKQTKPEAVISALTACFANIGFVGLPIAEAALGDEGVRLFLVIMSFHSLTLVPVTFALLSRYQKAKNNVGGQKPSPFTVVAILKSNPVLIALAVGISWSALSLPFPEWLDRIFSLPAQSAAPVGLFAGGLVLSRISLKGDLKQIMMLSAIKLVLVPASVWGISRHVLSLPDIYVHVAVLLAALPAGLIPYMIAADQKIAPRRAASTLLVTACLAPFSLTAILLLIFRNML